MKNQSLITITLILILFSTTKELNFENLIESKFSDAEIIDDNIVICYDGGLNKYSYDLKLVSQNLIPELSLNSKSHIHILDSNTIIVESSRAIYLIENNEIKYKLEYDSTSPAFFRQVLVIDSQNFLVLSVELTTSKLRYSLYNKNSEAPTTTVKSIKEYSHYTCSFSKLSSNNFITCFLVEDTNIFYSIFDSNLNAKVTEVELDGLPEPEVTTSYVYSISLQDSKLALLLIKNDDYENFIYNSYLVNLELKNIGGAYKIEKIGSEENLVVIEQVYTGNENFHIRKLNEEEFVVLFPVDDTKRKYNFNFYDYKEDIITVKEGYENIPITFTHKMEGLKFLKVNSDFAISFFNLNDQIEDEVYNIYLAYLTVKSCKDFRLTLHQNKNKEIDFSHHLISEPIYPEPDIIKVRIDTSNAPSISLLCNDNSDFDKEQFYINAKWTLQSGSGLGDFEINYFVSSANGYSESSCKIYLTIIKEDDTTQEGELDIENTDDTSKDSVSKEDILIDEEIKAKIEEMKEDPWEYFEQNTVFESEIFKITFYNTSNASQDKAIKGEGLSNVDLLSCETILRDIYKIPDDEVLNIIKVDIGRFETLSLQVEYEVYSESMKFLNLKHCENESVRITIPYNLKNVTREPYRRKLYEEIEYEEKYKLGLKYDYDILNPNSPFYTDICTRFDSEYSTDLLLEDRKKYYYISQLLCEDSCTYSSYNFETQKVECDCKTKTEAIYIPFYRTFISNQIDNDNTISNVNFKVFQCLGEGFKNFVENIGAWIMLIIFLGFIGLYIFIIFLKKNLKKVKNDMEEQNQEEGISYLSTDIKLADMPYELAIQKDQRKYLQMYLGTIKFNHMIFFSFINNKNENEVLFLRIMMFLLFISLLFLFNIFLFSDKDFTNYYLNKDKYDFGNEYPMAFVSTLICLLINMGLRILMQGERKNLRVLKRISNRTDSKLNNEEVALSISAENDSKFNNKILIFFFIGILVNFIVFLFVVSFCSIFINSQKYLLLRVLFSLITTFILPFIFSLVYAMCRYYSIKFQKEILYKISLIVQNY